MAPASRERGRSRKKYSSLALCALAVGCASPGPPRAPSLRLPDEVTDLEAKRIGDRVELTWTTPAKTTDGQIVRGPISAAICREENVLKGRPEPACTIVLTLPVAPGASKSVDILPAPLLADPPEVLAYSVSLSNDKGRSAGRSEPAFSVSGAAPASLTGFAVHGDPQGVEVTWNKGDSAVQVERVLVSVDKSQTAQPANDVVLGCGPTDAGGVLDTTAKPLATYRYKGWRERSIAGPRGAPIELRGPVTPELEYTVHDTFPPAVPGGLVVIAGLAGTHSLDLSWQPDSDVDLAGYVVYRRTGDQGNWVRLTVQAIAATAYTDASVVPGQRYFYRVTAVDRTGNESRAGAEVSETAIP